MQVAWGIIVTALALLAWGGQTLSWFAPGAAERLGLTERGQAVEPVFHADIRAEAAWDTATLWVMVVAGVLLSADVAAWAYFGLIGGGIYLYFGGRGIASRAAMQRRGFRVGDPKNVRVAYAMLAAWLLMAVVTVTAAVISLVGA